MGGAGAVASVALLVALPALSGCMGVGAPQGGHPCAGSTLDAEWIEPGLHARLADAAVDGVTIGSKEPPEPRIRNATLEALWGPVGLVEVAYRPGGGMNEATLAHESWNGGGEIYLGVTADAWESQETALGFADTLLARLDVPEEARRAHLDALREAWEPAPPGVANHVGRARLEAPIAWDAVPDKLFVNGTEERGAHGWLRDLREGPWRLAVRVGARTLDATIDGRSVHLEVAPDDRVVAFAQMAEAEPLAPALARINATLARAGAPPATFQEYSGAQMTC